jgi:hypothetical protein
MEIHNDMGHRRNNEHSPVAGNTRLTKESLSGLWKEEKKESFPGL